MSVLRTNPRGRWGLLLLLAAGCGEEGGSQGGEPLVRPDAGTDAGVVDAAMPSEDEDAGTEGEDAGVVSECRGDVTSFPALRGGEGPVFAVARHENQLELVYLDASCAGSRAGSPSQGLMHVSVPSSGDFGDSEPLVNLGDEVCQQTRYPALVAQASPAFTALFLSNLGGDGTALYTKGPAGDARLRDAAVDDHTLSLLVATRFADETKLAYALTPVPAPWPPPPAVQASALRVATLDGTSREIASVSDGYSPSKLVLLALDAAQEDAAAGVFAWISAGGDKPGVHFTTLDAEGARRTDVQTLATNIGATPSLALTKREAGGAIVYTTFDATQQVRFRSFDAKGVLSSERRLTLSVLEVRELALAAYSKGYVLAYREVTLGSQGGIRVMFLDEAGKIGRTRLVAEASSTAAGLDLSVAQDGRLFVTWVDPETVNATETTAAFVQNRVHVARVTCP